MFIFISQKTNSYFIILHHEPSLYVAILAALTFHLLLALLLQYACVLIFLGPIVIMTRNNTTLFLEPLNLILYLILLLHKNVNRLYKTIFCNGIN